MIDWNWHPGVRRAVARLHAGGVVAYPTEAVWGLGCDPLDERAVERILHLKRRERGMGLILIASSLSQLSPLLAGLSGEQRATLQKSWPGPHTWLVPDTGVAPEWITGGRDTVAVRVTDHPVAAAICENFGGPLVSTSANPHGMPPAKTALKVRCYFGKGLDAVAPGAVGKSGSVSSIRDLVSGAIIR